MWKLVVIDDDLNVLAGMEKIVPWAELNIEWAGSGQDGQEGIELAKKLQPDIMLTDIDMPVMNGLEMIEELQRNGYCGKFVILSGFSDFEYARQALRLQVDDYLSKPVTLETIKKVMSDLTAKLLADKKSNSKYDKLEHQLSVYEPYVVNEWMKSVLLGRPERTEQQTTAINQMKKQWNEEKHQVISIELVHSKKLDEWKLTDRCLHRFALSNITHEIAGWMYKRYDFVELDNYRSVLFIHLPLYSESDEQWMNKSQQLRMVMMKAIREHLHLEVTVGVGGVMRDWREISQSFDEAFHQTFHQDEGVVSIRGHEDTGIRSVRFYYELAEAVKNGQEIVAYQIVTDYFGIADRSQEIDRAQVYLFAKELWAILAHQLYGTDNEWMKLGSKFNPTEELLPPYTYADMKKWLLEKISEMIIALDSNENVKHKRIIEFMIQYIHQHYHEDITLADLSEKVFLSKNYLGQLFRNAIGEKFNQYLMRVRMEKAKNLILEGKLYIYEVAKAVGYNDIPYFTIQFKKYVGVTPSELIKGS